MRLAGLVAPLLVIMGLAGCKDSASAQRNEPPQTQVARPPRKPPYVVVAGEKLLPQVQRVLIITLDGMRPDLLLRANAPNVRALMSRGSFTMWARTVSEAETLPAHTSIVTGVTSEKHGIGWNFHLEGSHPRVPTLFELAKKAKLSTALVTGKTKLVALNKPGSVDWAFVPETEPNLDEQVATEAARIISAHQPDVMLVHLPNCDDLGHWHGWGTAEHVAIIEKADRAVGHVIQALRERRILDSTCILITADHGGQGYSHWGGDERSRYVPWIAAGPGIRQDFDLTLFEHRAVNVMDTFATACALLGIPYPDDVEGSPVLEIVDRPDLPQSPYAGRHLAEPTENPPEGEPDSPP